MSVVVILGAAVGFVNIWLAKYLKQPSNDPIFDGLFESACYLALMLLFRAVLMGMSKNVSIVVNPQTLFRKFGFWPLICVGGAFIYKYSEILPPKSDFLYLTLSQLGVIAVDGLVVFCVPRFFGPKTGSTELRDFVIRICVAAIGSLVCSYYLGTKFLSLLAYLVQYIALDKELHLINSNIAEVVIVNYGLATVFSLFFIPVLAVPSAETVAFLIHGILWKWMGILALHGLLYTGLLRGLIVFHVVRMAARFAVYGGMNMVPE